MIKLSSINKFFIFLFPIFFAMPDLSIPTGVINLRYDDLIIYILFLLNLRNIELEFKLLFKSAFFKIILLAIFYVFINIGFVFILEYDNLVSSYELIKFFGSLPYIIILPYLLSNIEYRKYFYLGISIGGVIYIFSIVENYRKIILEGLNTTIYYKLKSEISFSTLNPNAVASYAAILAWINIIGFYEYKRKIMLFIGIGLFLIPFFIFARGMSIGIIMSAIIIFFLIKKNIKVMIISIGIIIMAFITIQNLIDLELLKQATNIDLKTGQGFSGRYELWAQGIQLIEKSPIYGLGFATEHGQYVKYFNGHMSHDLYLHYLIELGFIGFLLFFIAILCLLYNKYRLYKKYNDFFYILQIGMILSFLITDISDQLMYFNKYAFLIYTMVQINLKKE